MPAPAGGFAQEVARSCELPFDKLPSIRCLWHLLGANGWFIAPFVVSLSNHASAFHLLVQSPGGRERYAGAGSGTDSPERYRRHRP
jgi:hypothetical protein